MLPPVYSNHAVIRVQGGAVEINDLSSRNGTSVNERKLAPNVWTPLQPNDQIDLCEYRFVLIEHPSTSEHGASDSVIVSSPSKSWSVSASRADALIRRDVENAREVQQSFLPSHTP